jgi:hypothetical protein
MKLEFLGKKRVDYWNRGLLDYYYKKVVEKI